MGQRQEYTYLAVTPSAAAETASGQTVLFSSFGSSDEGNTLPTFTVAPLVEIISEAGDQKYYIDHSETTVNGYVLHASDFGGGLADYSVRITSRETTAASAGAPGTSVVFYGYCSGNDVEDHLISNELAMAATKSLNIRRRRRFITQGYAAVNAALQKGGYNVPLTNAYKTTIAAGVSNSNNVVSITLTDSDNFSVGNIVRIHGSNGSNYNDEFVAIVNLDTDTDVAVVDYLENSYDSGSTIEVCTDGFLFARKANSIYAALLSLDGLVVAQGRSRNDKVSFLHDLWMECKEAMESGNVPGVSQSGVVFSSFQTNNPSDKLVTNGFAFTMTDKY